MPSIENRDGVLDQLIRAATFEQLLQSRYIGNKRFSIEGIEALIPLLTEMLHEAGEREALMAVLAMAHRGRLNVMAHVVGRPAVELFAGFEDVDPRSIMGAGDVKYHSRSPASCSISVSSGISASMPSIENRLLPM